MRPGRRPAAALLASLALLVPAASSARADGAYLRAEFWTDIEPVPGVGDEWPVGPGTARSRILDEAAWVYGGMIWGFEFKYTPYDKTRGLEERFDLAPIQSLAPGELSLTTEGAVSTSDARRAFVLLQADPSLASLMEGYAHEPWKACQGIGRADMDRGVKGRREAYIDGLRAAVRSLLQGLEPNKPRLVRGRVVFHEPPSLAIIGGYYTAQVRARAMVVEVIPYKVF
jgi:hypothetical protein